MNRIIIAATLAAACLVSTAASARPLRIVTCYGTFTDMPTVGLQIAPGKGDPCDLNGLSRRDIKRMTDVCGPLEDMDIEILLCSIRAVITPHQRSPHWHQGFKGYVNVVQKLISVTAPNPNYLYPGRSL